MRGDSDTMTEENPPVPTPADLTGTVREVQSELERQYGATECTIRFPSYGEEETDRLTFALTWRDDDLPREPDRSPIASHVEMLGVKIEKAMADWPNADVSTYTDHESARLNIVPGSA